MQILRHVHLGEVDRAEAELRAGADPNGSYPSRDSETLLGQAAVSPHAKVEMLDLLLDHGAEIDHRTSGLGCSALHLAARHGTVDKVRRLVERGASLHKKSSGGYTAVLHAALNPSAEAPGIIHCLIERGVDPHAASEYGESPLGVAAGRGRRDLVRILMDSGVDPHSVDWTQLHCEIALGKSLLQEECIRGIDLEKRDRAGRTPLLLALNLGDAQQAETLTSWGAEGSVLAAAGRTSLMLAARSGEVEAVEWCLGRPECVPEACDQAGYDGLAHAVECAAVESARLLLASGVDPAAARPLGDDLIHLVPFHQDPNASARLLHLLCNAGADPTVIASTGDHPLRDAAQYGCEEALEFLLQCGVPADLNSTGETALHAAVAADEDGAVRLLLEAGADPLKEDVDGDRPVEMARSKEVATLLGAPFSTV